MPKSKLAKLAQADYSDIVHLHEDLFFFLKVLYYVCI